MKLLITGTRNEGREDCIRWIKAWIRKYGKPDVLIVGCCPTGVDKLVRDWAETRVGMKVFYADWKKLGPAAGPERNKRMVQYCEPGDHCLGFPLGIAKGTRGCMKLARAHGMKVKNCKVLK